MDLESLRKRPRVGGPIARAFANTATGLYRTGAIAAPIIANAVQNALNRSRSAPARVMRRRMQGRSRSVRRRPMRRRRGRGRSLGILSQQRDQTNRRVRTRYRRGGRFNRRVVNVLMNQQPLRTWTVQKAVNQTSSVNKQSYYGIGLFTTNQTDQPDLFNVFADGSLALGTATERPGRLFIKSACLDVEIKNTGVETIIMDIYEILNVKDVNTTNDIGTQWNTFFNQQSLGVGGIVKDPQNVAVSVFENPAFCQHYKVLSKREVMIQGDQIISLQMRYGKDYKINGNTVVNYQGSIPKLAKFFFFMWHGPPDPAATISPDTPGLLATTLTFAYQKSYKYGVSPSFLADVPTITNT